MTPEETIEALREWVALNEMQGSEWADGYNDARHKVRDIIDPPVRCRCGAEDVTGCTVQRSGFLHTEAECDECCQHGVFLGAVCDQCHPPTPKWRALVDEAATFETSTPLPAVLRLIANLDWPLGSEYLGTYSGLTEPRWEYAPEGTSQKLRDAEAAIERVRALHKVRVRALHKVCTKIPFDEGGCEPGDCDEPVCVHDGQAWPCLTIRALEEGKQ